MLESGAWLEMRLPFGSARALASTPIVRVMVASLSNKVTCRDLGLPAMDTVPRIKSRLRPLKSHFGWGLKLTALLLLRLSFKDTDWGKLSTLMVLLPPREFTVMLETCPGSNWAC